MSETDKMKENWERSFDEQIRIGAYNTAAVEAIARNVSYYLREVPAGDYAGLHFLEMGCGGGANLLWLAGRGIRVSGADISPTALKLCRRNFEQSGLNSMLADLVESSVDGLPFPDGSFDGIIEACVFQHLEKGSRRKAFAEVGRLLKPGGVFCGYMLGRGHTVYQLKKDQEFPDDPGTLDLRAGASNIYLTDIGLSHFFAQEEFHELLDGFTMIDPCLSEYYLPGFEARKRGYEEYKQSMWAVYAVK